MVEIKSCLLKSVKHVARIERHLSLTLIRLCYLWNVEPTFDFVFEIRNVQSTAFVLF